MLSILKSPFRYIFFFGLLVYLITAYFSTGCYHPDEHFQILEFCNFKLGQTPLSDMPWEFSSKIRPALQPSVTWSAIKILNFFHINNPFTYTLIFRVITALITWFVTSKISLLLIKDFATEKGKLFFLFLCFFLWYIPFISVRFSSENYSAITFLSAAYIIIKVSDNISERKMFQLGFAGLLLGFSFYFRFQIGFAFLGLGLWLLIIKRMCLSNFFILLISGILAIIICIFIDFRFYGNFELTPYNYFYANIIEQKAAGFGTSPWWYYSVLFILFAIPPLSIFLLGFFFIGLYKKKNNIFAWCIVPFIVLHCCVAHKEIRFLFPLVFAFLYLTAIGIDYIISTNKYKKILYYIFIISLIINIPCLFVKMIFPAQEIMPYWQFLYDYSNKRQIILLSKGEDIYNYVGLQANFYKSPTVKCVNLQNDHDISDYLGKNNPASILIAVRNLLANEKFAGYKTETIFCPYPEWLVHFNYTNWLGRSRIWKIMKLTKIKKPINL